MLEDGLELPDPISGIDREGRKEPSSGVPVQTEEAATTSLIVAVEPNENDGKSDNHQDGQQQQQHYAVHDLGNGQHLLLAVATAAATVQAEEEGRTTDGNKEIS